MALRGFVVDDRAGRRGSGDLDCQESNSVVRWDEAAEQIVDNPTAAGLLKRDYRKPYVHPYRTA